MFRGVTFVPGSRRLLVLLSPLPIALVALAAVMIYQASAQPPPRPLDLRSLAEVPPVPGLMVYVSGAVAHPGLYRLSRGDRLYAAIAAAGGFTPDADPLRVPDLAERLRDGQQVKVPIIGISSSGSATKAAKVDLNSATAAELSTIPGFTPDIVSAAVAYRDGYGGFASTRELVTVLGMGEAQYNAAKQYIRV